MGANMSPRSNRTFGILIVLGALLACILLVYLDKTHPDQPESIVKTQIETIQEGKWTEAYYSFTSKEFQAATSLDEFKRYIRAFPEIQKDSKVSVGSIREENNLKEVDALIENPNANPIKIEFQLIKEDEKWKILNLRIGTEEKVELNSSQKAVISTIEDVLKLIKNSEYERVYNAFTTTTFQKEFTLGTFKDFIKSYPILAIFTYTELIDISDSDDTIIATVRFENSLQKTSTAFTLKKMSSGWKIENIQILEQEAKPGFAKTFNEEEVALPIRQMLFLIKNKNSEKAYQIYTAQAFKDSTSLSNFEKFIESNPILIEYKLPELKKLQFNNNIAEYTVLLDKPPEKPQEALFSLIKEKGEWKVLQIQLNETEE
jgi:hypothetical protein